VPLPINVESHLPLTEATLFILLSLAPGQKHGYAIMKDITALSQNRVLLSTGTLYGALKRLLDQRWIERVDEGAPDGEANETSRPRKAYRLTRLGRHILEAEAARLQKLARATRMRLAQDQA
jgi:DNA-binding PadR family transcriptional regulator